MRKFFGVLLICLMALGFCHGEGTSAENACGENAVWVLDQNGKMTITGTGEIARGEWSTIWASVNELEVSSGITSIAEDTFSYFGQLKSLVLPEGLQKIGARAFHNCPLEKVTFRAGLKEIGEGAFQNSRLKEVSFPEGLLTIGANAFYSSPLEKVTFPNSLQSIGEKAFDECKSLMSVTLPDNIISFGEHPFSAPGFQMTYSDTTIYASPGTETAKALGRVGEFFRIPGGNFYLIYQTEEDGTQLLTLRQVDREAASLSLPENLQAIGGDAFNQVTSLAEVKLPAGITKVSGTAFSNSNVVPLASIGSDTAKALGAAGLFFREPGHTDYDLIYINDLSEEKICLTLRNADKSLTSVKIPDGVEIIDEYAFENCTKLKSVTMPDSVIRLNTSAFGGCTKLSEVKMSANLRTMTYYVFSGCSKLKKIVMPENMDNIYFNAMDGCDAKLYSAWETTTAKTLGKVERSFYINGSDFEYRYISLGSDKQALALVGGISPKAASVKVPEGVESLGNGYFQPFHDCTGLKYVELPKSVINLNIGDFAGVDRYFYIKCKSGSAAERFARQSGFQYDNGKKKVIGSDITSVAQKVSWVVSNYVTAGMSEKEKALVLHNWLIVNAHYDLTYSVYSPSGVLIQGKGVCDSFAQAYELLLTKAGIANRYTSGKCNNNTGAGWEAHAWNLVRIDGQWYHVDTTWDDPVYSVAKVETDTNSVITGMERTRYFLVSDQEMRKNHQWSGFTTDDNHVTGYHDNGVAYHYGDAGNYEINTSSGKAALVKGKATAKTVTIPDSVTENGTAYKVTSIAAEAFANSTKLTKVTIGKNVTSIGDSAFVGCTKLTAVKMGNGVTKIGDSAFSGCAKLKTLSLGNKVTSIGNSAFRGCGALTSVTIPAKVKSIGEYAFQNCKKLKSITIKTTKLTSKTVGAEAFSGIHKKVTVTLPSGKEKAYQKLLLKKGVPETAVFKP